MKHRNHTYHVALVDRQHEDLLTVCIWKDRKLHAVYLLDHYESIYFTPDRLKIQSGPGASRSVRTRDGKYLSIPVWDRIFLRYVIHKSFSSPDRAKEPSTKYSKHNYVTFELDKAGTFDMRKQRFNRGFVYRPKL